MADKLKIRPLHDRVIIQRLDAETRSREKPSDHVPVWVTLGP